MGELKIIKEDLPKKAAEKAAEVLREVAVKNARKMWRRSARIAVPIASIGGFCADCLAPLGPIVIYLAVLTLALSVISGIIWYGVKRHQIRAALADGHIDEDEYDRINNRGTWPTLFSFSVLSSALLLTFAGAQKVFASSPNDKQGLMANTFPAIADLQRRLLRIEQSGTRIEHSLDDIHEKLDGLNAKFGQLSANGNIVENPKSPEEYYSNARFYEIRTDYAKARQSYLEYMKSNLPYLDPHLYFSGMLKLQEGRKGAIELYGTFQRDSQPAPALARALLLEDREARLKALQAFAKDYPDYGPVQYFLSREFAAPESGQQTLENMKKEREALEKFQELSQRGLFSRFFLDKRMAVSLENEAAQRAAKYSKMSDDYLNAPAKVTILPGNEGWEALIVLPFDGAEAMIKLPGDADYRSTGFLETKNPADGRPMPNTKVSLAHITAKGTISLKYRDAQGVERGPFAVEFDPVRDFVSFAKRLLPKDAHELAPVFTYKGKKSVVLVQILMFREALLSVTIGESPEEMTTSLKLPPKTGKFTTNEISSDSPLAVQEIPDGWSRVYLQMKFADGTTSETLSLE